MTYVSEEFYEQTTTTTYPAAGAGGFGAVTAQQFPTQGADYLGGDYHQQQQQYQHSGYGADYGAAATSFAPASPSRFGLAASARPSSPLRSTSPTGTYRPLRTPPPIPASYAAGAGPSPSFRAQPQQSPYRSPTAASAYHQSPSFRSRSPVTVGGGFADAPIGGGSLYNATAPLPSDNEDYEYVYFRETRDQQPTVGGGFASRSPTTVGRLGSPSVSGYAPAPPMPPVDYDYAAPQPAYASAYATASPRYETTVSRAYGDDFGVAAAAPLRSRSPTAFDTRVSYASPSFRASSPVSFAQPAATTYSPSFARPSSPSFVRPSSPSFVRPSSPSFVSAGAPLTTGFGGGQVVEEYEEYYSREEY